MFLLVYGALSLAYKFYLDFSKNGGYYPDYVTNLVAHQTKALLNAVGYNAVAIPHPDEPSLKLVVRGKYVARVVEGCNAMSVIILFISFIVAFSGKPKTTLFYGLAGSALLYSVNLVRIAVLALGLFHYPWRRETLHKVIFPLLIYGMVFLLWMLWVKRFSTLNSKKHV